MAPLSDRIWRELRDSLRGFIVRRVGPEDADDLVQEVFVRIHRRIDTLDRADRLGAWAYQIARNAIIDYHRSRARWSTLLAEDVDLPERSDGDAAAPADDFDPAESERELAACLTPLVEQLGQPYRQAVELVELQGLPQAAAAARAGLSTSGMKSRVQRARRQLKSLLLDCCHVELDRLGGVVEYRAHGGRCGACNPAGERLCCAD